MKIHKTHSPHTIEELVRCLNCATMNTRIISGGTDLIISMREKNLECDLLIGMQDIESLRLIEDLGDELSIGAAATYAQIQTHPLINEYAKCLSDASSKVGSPQIRNRGTLAGNIANASAAGDGVPPLLVLNAKVETLNGSGCYSIRPISEIIAGSGVNCLACDEAIIRILIPKGIRPVQSAFMKLGSRSSVTISKISIAIACEENIEIGGMDFRIAMGSVGSKAHRIESVEQLLVGARIDLSSACILSEALSAYVMEAIKGRSSMPYKKNAVIGLAYDVIREMFPILEINEEENKCN